METCETELERRIRECEEEIANEPNWIQANSIWQGGSDMRTEIAEHYDEQTLFGHPI